MISIEDIRRNARELPPLPDIAMRLMSMTENEDIAPREVVEIIRHDAGLTTRVLRLCNSPFYGLPRRISSLHEAVVYIGLDALVNIALASCMTSFYGKANKGYGLAETEAWRHAVGVAIASQAIAERTHPELRNLAFTAGLLHDIGKILLNAMVAKDFETIISKVENEKISFLKAERMVIGITHPEAGGELARLWNLPNELKECIEFHHSPQKAQSFPELVSIVHIANILCLSFGVGIGSDGLAYECARSATSMLQMDREGLERVDPQAAQRVHPHDRVRTIRALEVYEATGKPLSQLQQEGRQKHQEMEACRIVMTGDREELYRRIDRRVDEMIERGFVEEVRNLLDRGVPEDGPAMRAIGYREAASYINGVISHEEAIEKTKMLSRRYAKQQMVLYRQWQGAVWLDFNAGLQKNKEGIQILLEF